MKKYRDEYEEQLCQFIIKDIEAEKRKINAWTENIIKDASRDILKAEAVGKDKKHAVRIRKHINKLMAVKKLVVDKPLNDEVNGYNGLIDFLLELKNSIVIKEFECELLSMRREMLSLGEENFLEDREIKRLYNRFMNLYNRFDLSIYLCDKSDIGRLYKNVMETLESDEICAEGKKEALISSIKKMYKLQEKLMGEEEYYMEEAKENIINRFNITIEDMEEEYV